MKKNLTVGLITLLILSCGQDDAPDPQLMLPPMTYTDYADNQREFTLTDLDDIDQSDEYGILIKYFEIDLQGNILANGNPEDFEINISINFSTEPFPVNTSLSDKGVNFRTSPGNWIESTKALWKTVKINGQPNRLALNYRPGILNELKSNFINGGQIVGQPSNQFFERHLSYVWYETIVNGADPPHKHLVIYTPVNLELYNVRNLDFGDEIDGYVVHRFDMGVID